MATSAPWRRRAVLAASAGGLIGWVWVVPRLAYLGSPQLTFREIQGLAPFRELERSGMLSTGTALLTGLDEAKLPEAAHATRIAAVLTDPCRALFGSQTDPRLPIAFFSDFNCPNCRVLDEILTEYDAANPGTIRIVRHELPLLGAASTTASQAVLAADRQGGYAVMHERLMKSRMVTDLDYVIAMAESVGLDGQQLVEDMQTPEILSALDNAKAIADVFGFYGTPCTVVGRTVFRGAIPAADVATIILSELDLPIAACDAG